jgi:ABC-type nitrate/sulfonate/bicarbonate transport system ATPase subunit
MNGPDDILSAWTALEVLCPLSYARPEHLAGGDRTRVAALGDGALPWERAGGGRPRSRLYYQVVLGSIALEPPMQQLLARYGDSREERPSIRGKAALAVVVVDRDGRLVESPSVGISSFGWGVTAALRGELADLARWPDVERGLTDCIEKRLLDTAARETDEEARQRPVTREALQAAYQALALEFDLPRGWVEPPEFAIRSYVYYRDPNPPEPLLLNSFFLADLAAARELLARGDAPPNLRRYLGVDLPESRADLLRDRAVLEQAVSPGLTPLARWPGPGRHPLVLLQQAAVNLAFRETKAGGLLGVNGPPGTGKTTLLRDLVAGVVAARAEAMAKFDDPETAFEHSGQTLRAGNSWIHLYRLSPSLRGFEMVVASSNNKAVENVSAELPGLGAIADDAPKLRYLSTLSDALHQSATWGVIAAVLGNAQNRARFKQAFWWDEDNGLNSYLSAAAGSPRQVEVADPETGRVERRTPRIVDRERPPSTREEALARWRRAREQFLDSIRRSRRWQGGLDSLRSDLASLPRLAQTEAGAASKHEAAVAAATRLDEAAAEVRQAEAESARRLEHADRRLGIHRSARPGFWARLFRTRAALEWSERFKHLCAEHRRAEAQHSQAIAERRRTEDERDQAQLDQHDAKIAWYVARAQHQQVRQRLAEVKNDHGVVLVDEAFFALPHDKRHQMTPWFPSAAQRARDEVFIAAMAVHRAFIDAAAKPLRHNLGALMNAFSTQSLPGAEK